MRTASMTISQAALPHVRTPGVILIARDLKGLISLLISVAKRWSRL
jgi:hypothetical protein